MSVTEVRAEQRLVAALRATAEAVVAPGAATTAMSPWPAEEVPLQFAPAPHEQRRARRRRWTLLPAIACVCCAITGIVLAFVLSGPSRTPSTPFDTPGSGAAAASSAAATTLATAGSSTLLASSSPTCGSPPEVACATSSGLVETASGGRGFNGSASYSASGTGSGIATTSSPGATGTSP